MSALRLSRAAALLLSLLLLGATELSTRAWVRATFDIKQCSELDKMLRIARGQAHEHLHHPFLHHVGNPEFLAVPYPDQRDILELLPEEEWHPYDTFGFPGPIPSYAKDPGTLRVACLGGSTTVSGYPQKLEKWLADRMPQGTRAEVLNFGVGGYTSAHSLVNFVLNAVDFDPDVVIVHHAWNDASAALQGCALRGDYAHLRSQSLPDASPSIERWVAPSVVWRLLRSGPGDTAGSGGSAKGLEAAHSEQDCGDVDPLWPYRRNLETIVNLSSLQGMQVILTTQPHREQRHTSAAIFIDACNDAVREIHREHPDTLLVDLAADHATRGEDDFMDLCHMTPEGVQWKAERIGDVLLPSLPERQAPAR